MRKHFFILKVPRTLRFSVVLRILSYYHPTPKRSGYRTVVGFPFQKICNGPYVAADSNTIPVAIYN